jgi:hypothetical protein
VEQLFGQADHLAHHLYPGHQRDQQRRARLRVFPAERRGERFLVALLRIIGLKTRPATETVEDCARNLLAA